MDSIWRHLGFFSKKEEVWNYLYSVFPFLPSLGPPFIPSFKGVHWLLVRVCRLIFICIDDYVDKEHEAHLDKHLLFISELSELNSDLKMSFALKFEDSNGVNLVSSSSVCWVLWKDLKGCGCHTWAIKSYTIHRKTQRGVIKSSSFFTLQVQLLSLLQNTPHLENSVNRDLRVIACSTICTLFNAQDSFEPRYTLRYLASFNDFLKENPEYIYINVCHFLFAEFQGYAFLIAKPMMPKGWFKWYKFFFIVSNFCRLRCFRYAKIRWDSHHVTPVVTTCRSVLKHVSKWHDIFRVLS